MDESPILFASGLVRFYPEHQLLASGNYHLTVPEKQLEVLEPLVAQLGELVLTEELIDITQPGLIANSDRYKQQLRVQAAIGGLRRNFDRFLDGLGDPKTGIVQSEFGKGYYLSKYWVPSENG